MTSTRRELRDLLRNTDAPLTIQELAASINVTDSTVRRHLNEIPETESVTLPQKGKPRVYTIPRENQDQLRADGGHPKCPNCEGVITWQDLREAQCPHCQIGSKGREMYGAYDKLADLDLDWLKYKTSDHVESATVQYGAPSPGRELAWPSRAPNLGEVTGR